MNEPRPLSEEQKNFKDRHDLRYGDVKCSVEPGCKYVDITVDNVLDIGEAEALRDWLNEVLP